MESWHHHNNENNEYVQTFGGTKSSFETTVEKFTDTFLGEKKKQYKVLSAGVVCLYMGYDL